MSTTPLAACPSCARHIRVNEALCPFCAGPLPSPFTGPTRPTAASRLSRAALYALGVGALSAGTAACGGAVTTGGTRGGDGSAAQNGSDGNGPFMGVAIYGGTFAVPVDASVDAGAQEAAPVGLDAAYGVPADATATDGQADVLFPWCSGGACGAGYGGPFLFLGSAADASDAQSLTDAAYGGVPIEPEAGPTDGAAPE